MACILEEGVIILHEGEDAEGRDITEIKEPWDEVYTKIGLLIYPESANLKERFTYEDIGRILYHKVPEEMVNPTLKELLEGAPADMIAKVAMTCDNRMCMRELRRRLREDEIRDMEELFRILLMMLEHGMELDCRGGFPDIVCERIKRYAYLAPEEQIIAILKGFFATRSRDLYWPMVYLLVYGPDPWGRIHEETKDCCLGSTNLKGVWNAVRYRRPPELKLISND
jgi:hypothetical protein